VSDPKETIDRKIFDQVQAACRKCSIREFSWSQLRQQSSYE